MTHFFFGVAVGVFFAYGVAILARIVLPAEE